MRPRSTATPRLTALRTSPFGRWSRLVPTPGPPPEQGQVDGSSTGCPIGGRGQTSQRDGAPERRQRRTGRDRQQSPRHQALRFGCRAQHHRRGPTTAPYRPRPIDKRFSCSPTMLSCLRSLANSTGSISELQTYPDMHACMHATPLLSMSPRIDTRPNKSAVDGGFRFSSAGFHLTAPLRESC